ncbi:helix-turn-helix transcriptional regulator [Kineosporia rhizophila]|uniref:helix-turn-helix domain-containing protein n=1 Tax=Kineosporia rhizophila TaxID=84633 RepID=UPI000ACE7373|nr:MULTISPECIES: helix-turn-helix transcriptional regulator [Kineosporia]MCE0536970.1 helix-turn-helix transcriptional regulator [Kineosporia rhizophila]GLY19127.1 transcriptional regulator [Kineosporia sp. NBRC 101677]
MLLRGLIGTVLRRIRLGQGRTLKDVAETARVSVPYLSEVERGRKEASSELLASICEALGLDMMDLLSEVRFELETERLAELATQPRTIGFTALAQTELAPRPSLSSNAVGLHSVSMAAA